MNSTLSRRHFLGSALLAWTGYAGLPGLASAASPWRRPGTARLALSLAAYSFRDFFVENNREKSSFLPETQRMTLLKFIDFCADHGCDGTELTSYYFPSTVTDNDLIQLRRHAFLRGLSVSGTAVGNTFTLPPGPDRDREIASVKTWIHRASVMGAPHIRVFAGEQPKNVSKDEAIQHCVAALEECGEAAGQAGIFLGVENHGGIVAEADSLLRVIEQVKSPWVGVNLDTGNFHTDDPYVDLEKCAPYAVNVQVKVQIQPRGQKAQASDLTKLIGILRNTNYQGYVALEYESSENPWEAVPRHLKELKSLLG